MHRLRACATGTARPRFVSRGRGRGGGTLRTGIGGAGRGEVFSADKGGHVDALFRLMPRAGVCETSIGAHTGDEAHRRGLDGVRIFQEQIEDGANIAAAKFVKAGGASVAVHGGPIGQIKEVRDGLGAVPVDEQLFDGFSFGMAADGALALMALEIGSGRRGGNGAGIGAKTPLHMRGSRS